ncbi:hypothetical protein A5750_05310 [Mycobacterium sp. 852002-51613_SCH5001154]|nr:hypothetical protein A5750_05310 [Mycobacterium sp. 852002-51613_SCH5001154]
MIDRVVEFNLDPIAGRGGADTRELDDGITRTAAAKAIIPARPASSVSSSTTTPSTAPTTGCDTSSVGIDAVKGQARNAVWITVRCTAGHFVDRGHRGVRAGPTIPRWLRWRGF